MTIEELDQYCKELNEIGLRFDAALDRMREDWLKAFNTGLIDSTITEIRSDVNDITSC